MSPVPLCRRGGRLTFLLLRQKQSKQKKRRTWCLRRFLGSESKFAEPKARPAGAVLCTAAKLASDPNNRNLWCSAQPGSRANSPDGSDNRGPLSVRACAPRRIHKGFGDGLGTGFGNTFKSPGVCVAIIFIAARAGTTLARGLNHLQMRSSAWFWGSDRDFAAQHPWGAPKAWRIRALPPKTPDPASEPAPVSMPPTPCGRAEQRRLGRTKILDVRRLRSRQVSKISGPAEQRKESRSEAQGP